MAAVVLAPIDGYESDPLPLRPQLRVVPDPPRRRRARPEVRRRRRVVAAAATSLFAVLAVASALAAGTGAPGSGPLTATGSPAAASVRPAAAHVWTVRPGDTLWSIVEASGVRGDPRPVVDRLAADLGGRPLEVGQRIVVP